MEQAGNQFPRSERASGGRGRGELVFAPAPGQDGNLRFTVTATNGVRSVTERVPITVTAASQPSTEVSGQIIDETGQPVAGVPVEIGNLKTTSDAQGRFTLAGVPAQPDP
jgi:hypothetical protein